MNGIRPVLDLISLAYYRWARSDLQRKNPMHPDLPFIVTRINTLEASQ